LEEQNRGTLPGRESSVVEWPDDAKAMMMQARDAGTQNREAKPMT